MNLVLLPLFAIFYFWSAAGKVVPALEQGFFFDYNKPNQPVPIPVTEQCETIHITWSRGTATGPNPVGPYSLVVYTSTDTQPFVIQAGDDKSLSFDWQVPFSVGTQYQICMYDSKGTAGGCQAIYTVIQNTTVATPTCQNVTYPIRMDVIGTVAGGTQMSQFGWIDSCTDVSITPLNGTPPYILTVAPALAPPINITSNTRDPIVWTVSMSRSLPFFLSLVSADGMVWQNGPMHSGGDGTTDCLAPGTIPEGKARALAAGAGIGGAFGTALLIVLVMTFRRYRSWTLGRTARLDAIDASHTGVPTWSNRFDSEAGHSPSIINPFSAASEGSVASRRVFLLHQDGGRTVLTPDQVVELPPGYAVSPTSDGPPPPLPEKSRRL